MDKRKKRAVNTDLADWHKRVQDRMKKSGSTVTQAAAAEKKAEMRFYRKKKTPGTGN